MKSLADRVATAEVMWSLKMVESNLSYNSSEDIVAVLQKMDPDSLVLINLHAIKTSVMAAEMGRKAIVKEQAKQKKLQEALVLHVGKKPKMV